jgi:hypothetical protein
MMALGYKEGLKIANWSKNREEIQEEIEKLRMEIETQPQFDTQKLKRIFEQIIDLIDWTLNER